MLKRAEELAAEVPHGKEVAQPGAGQRSEVEGHGDAGVSWMTVGPASQFSRNAPPKLSEVPGVIDAGAGLHASRFRPAQFGDVGVAVNQPQTIAYVVRITTGEPPQQVLRDMFLADKMNFGYMSIAREEDAALVRTWIDQCNRVAKLVRSRPPADERMDVN